MKFLAFDLETASIGNDADSASGICCWAIASFAESLERVRAQSGHGKLETGRPSPRMNRAECRDLVGKLTVATEERGFTLLTHNGIGFDLRILAEESQMWDECRHLARGSVDMMLHFHCIRGFSVGLEAVAKGMGIKGKIEGMHGGLVPELWSVGKYSEVLEYVKQDAVATLEVGMEVDKTGVLSWITKKGKKRYQKIERWLRMREAMRLPIPNTQWMDEPRSRESLVEWMVE